MVDFESLLGTKSSVETFDLEKIFDSLDVKSTHTDPRPSQREALADLTKRESEKDLILKISTGAGKTAIGLLFLYGHMRVSGQPVVYLCPTRQLVDQVIEEAGQLGISAVDYPGGETYPRPEALRGESVLVCTYEKIFNAKSTFKRHDVNLVPYAIVMDDAHAGVENIRKQFTLRLRGEPYGVVSRLLESACKSYNKTKWMDVASGDPLVLFEVPHWIWTDLAQQIQEALHGYAQDDDFRFVWPFIQGQLPLCRCVISGDSIEIAPEVLPTDQVRAFSQAKHRLFMSATLADDSLLVRELGVSGAAACEPILPPSDKGLGERMILAPGLVDESLGREFNMALCQELAKTFNVVVLTSSERQAQEWAGVGGEYFAGDRFIEGVRRLKQKSAGGSLVVFAQRYDGVDLPDEACRILVIDGLPQGESLIDKADSHLALLPGGVRNRTIFRIEQGMGRPVRSHADFAVVLLVGQDLATYVGRKDVLSAMTNDTRNQLRLSVELANLAKKSDPAKPGQALLQIIDQCLTRDSGWKRYYTERVRNAPRENEEIDESRVMLAEREREAHLMAANNLAFDAKKLFREAINSVSMEEEELGILLQRLARIAYLSDQSEGLQIQQSARQKCQSAAVPPSAPRRPSKPGGKTVAENFAQWFSSFAQSNAAVLEARRIADSLNLDSKAKQVEGALKKLGEALGATSSRPEEEFASGQTICGSGVGRFL